MKRKIFLFLQRLIAWLETFRDKFSETSKSDSELPYDSLSPIENADTGNHYYEALDWAFQNRKTKHIRNIALTGPYGSGKSSILRTFQRKTTNKDLHFLNISLATFKEETNRDQYSEVSERQRLIEVSILQQILYREKDDNIPDSRFRKIKSYSTFKLMISALGLMLFLLALANFINPNSLHEFFNNYFFPRWIRRVIHYLTYLVLVFGVYGLLFRSIRVLTSLKVNKLSIQNAEIELNDSTNKSILNHHLDELLYFFEVTKYNVVIIEDLDRFKETEIFTKLRELNFILNNSEKTKNKEIVFVYAVRDDIFIDKERTKFFDFIVPVIPVINSSNSSAILLSKQKKLSSKFSDNLIDSISLFIDDMRLLHNVVNEYNIYSVKLDGSLDQDKLLAMIVYKNLYPKDFALLSSSQGELFKWLSCKPELIADESTTIQQEIDSWRARILQLETVRILDIKELRSLYILQIVGSCPKFATFTMNGRPITIDALKQDGNFDYVIKDSIRYDAWAFNQSYYRDMTNDTAIPVKFVDVEKLVHKRPYQDRMNDILDAASKKIDVLRENVREAETRKDNLKHKKLKELFSVSGHALLMEGEEPAPELVRVLLRGGYIAEDYMDYITIFYEGSITRADHKFLLLVKSQRPVDPDYKLANVDKIIARLNPIDFTTKFVLNYDLINHVMNGEGTEQLRQFVLNKLSDQSAVSIQFIDGYIDHATNVNIFISGLSKSWDGLWAFVQDNSSFTEERKTTYLKLILVSCDLADLERLAKRSNLLEAFSNRSDGLILLDDRARIKKIVNQFKVRFTAIDFENTPLELIDFIYEHSYYEINPHFVQNFIKQKGKFDQVAYDRSNYSLVLNSNCKKLADYVSANIDLYLNNVYFTIDSNVAESEDSYVELLNNSEIDADDIKKLIIRVETKIRDLNAVDSTETQDLLLTESKVVPSWNNLAINYARSEDSISQAATIFMSREDNASELSKKRVPLKVGEKDLFSKFFKAVLSSDDIDDAAYALITKSNSWWFSDLPLAELSESKVKSLIVSGCLKFTKANYSAIKSAFDDLHILFASRNKKTFFEMYSDFELDSNDLLTALRSVDFSTDDKEKIIAKVDPGVVTSNAENVAELGRIVLKTKSFSITDGLVRNLISKPSIEKENRVKLFIAKEAQVPNESITDLLRSLGEPFDDIAIRGKRPLIPEGKENQTFVELLLAKKYISSFEQEKDGIRVMTFRT